MLKREYTEKLLYGHEFAGRFTQDTPILPDVWIRFAESPQRQDLLITPLFGPGGVRSDAGLLAKVLRESLKAESATPTWKRLHPGQKRSEAMVAYNQSAVAAKLTFEETVRVVLPLSKWWKDRVAGAQLLKDLEDPAGQRRLAELMAAPPRIRDQKLKELTKEYADLRGPGLTLIWMARVIGTIGLATESTSAGAGATREERAERAWPALLLEQPPSEGDSEDDKRQRLAYYERVVAKVVELINGVDRSADAEPLVYSVSCNRRIESTVWRSAMAIKADAARNVFGLRCDKLTWAVVDTGVDARHPAFRKRYFNQLRGRELPIPLPRDLAQGTGDAEQHPRHKEWRKKQKEKTPAARANWSDRTRVLASYDFSIIRYLLLPDDEVETLPAEVKRKVETARTRLERGKKGQSSVSYRLRSGLKEGRELEWSVLKRLIEVPHDREYEPPAIDHGTHVAGILAADWRRSDTEEATEFPVDSDVRGVCSDINVLDLRVFDADGEGDEFTVLAAMQFLQSLNAHKDYQVVHGVNLSLSIRHDVANYACGRTPVCEEAERLVASGLVVVAAAGNDGHMKYMTAEGLREGYQGMSITDPGNAEGVITVGATHRDQPHTYGVSYFSSRGPTGDGRAKPDLVAPGEKISAPVLDANVKSKDGTSMAAPHVSGAAALLMARHLELAGQPRRIKEILCNSATDLGRERYFQGAGMLDILRAMQSV